MSSLNYDKETAVLFLVFNRPDTTLRVFEAIRKAAPKRLYVSADGPRTPAEQLKCDQTREILNLIDWDCQLFTNYSNENKGCKIAISEGISWFFNQEEEGIILEDDCLPSDSFFPYCSALLAHYRHDNRITHIGGSNLQLGQTHGDASYYFSNLTHVWGWAGWRRVWKNYDVQLKSFNDFKELDHIKNCPSHLPFKANWINALEKTYKGEIDTWDYQYAYLNLINNGLSVIPNQNLISNIGFRADATHTFDENNYFAELETELMTDLTHPDFVLPTIEADIFTQEKENYVPPLKKKNILSRTWKSMKNYFRSK